MPSFDGTGPFGDGRPGRGLGPCRRNDYYYSYGRGRGNYPYPRMRRNRNFFDWIRPLFGSVRRTDYPEESYDLKERKRALEEEINRISDLMKDTGEK